MCGRFSAGMPTPRVFDHQLRPAGSFRSARRWTRNRPPAGVYLTAFESRFESRRSICVRSAEMTTPGRGPAVSRQAFLFGRNLELIHHVRGDLGQIERSLLQHQLSRFGLRKQQQRAHDARQLLHVFERVDHRFAILLRSFGGEQRHFELPANRRQRRAQLMRNVGGKAADLLEGLIQARRSCD